MRSRNVTIWVIAIAAMLVLLGPLASQSRCDFVLSDNQQFTVNSSHSHGTLYNWSRAYIVTGGTVEHLYAYDSSAVDISGGIVYNLRAWNSSAVDITGGTVYGLGAYDSSTVDISAGYMDWLYAHYSSTVDISGGQVDNLCACGSSVLSFHGRNFSVGDGLMLDGNRVLGTGLLTGEWMDGTPWVMRIWENHPTVTILAIPEPATLLLLGLGGLALRRKRRSQCAEMV